MRNVDVCSLGDEICGIDSNCFEICSPRQMRDTYDKEARNTIYILTSMKCQSLIIIHLLIENSLVQERYRRPSSNVGRRYIDGNVFCSELLGLLDNKINSPGTKTYRTLLCSSDTIVAEPHPGYMSYATSFCSTAIIDGSKTNSKYPTRNPTESFARNE